MKARHIPSSVLLSLALLTLSTTAHAKARWGFAVFGGYQTYSMQDVNDAIGVVNSILASGGSPLRMDEINGGGSLGLGLRVFPSPDVRVSVDYERLSGSSRIEDATGSIDLSVPANAITGNVTYLFPSHSTARFGLGGGLGVYLADGSEKDVIVGTGSASTSWGGSGLGFHVMGQSDILLSKDVHLELGAGYRYAKADLSIEGASTNAQLDWSGFASRLGFAIYPK